MLYFEDNPGLKPLFKMQIMRRNVLSYALLLALFAGCSADEQSTGKSEVITDRAPEAIGPYSQAIEADNMIFVSGQIPMDPESGEILRGDIEQQTYQVLDNIEAVLHAAGVEMSDVVKTSVYLTDLDQFEQMNRLYAEYFGHPEPARETIEVSRLPGDVNIEISAIAVK